MAISVLTGQEGMISKVSEVTKEYKKQSLIEIVKSSEIALELDVILSENSANTIEKMLKIQLFSTTFIKKFDFCRCIFKFML